MDVGLGHDPHTSTGHRRRAAVLFADLTGFTELVETVEPEIVYQVVRPLLDDLASIAGRYGGEIQQVLGDGSKDSGGRHDQVISTTLVPALQQAAEASLQEGLAR